MREAKGMDDIFLRDWFERNDRLIYKREKRKAFCSTCTTYSEIKKEAFKRIPTFRLASFIHGLQCPFVPIRPLCPTIAPASLYETIL